MAAALRLGDLQHEVGGQRLLDHGQGGLGDGPRDRVHDQQEAVESHAVPAVSQDPTVTANAEAAGPNP
jgi:hypothetical protein